MYFRGLTINQRNPNFENFKWLIKARSKKSPIVKHICFDGQSWVATDGHRLHTFDVPMNIYEKGFYKIVAENKSGIIFKKINGNITNYPEYKHLLTHKNTNRLPDIALNSMHIDIDYTRLIRLLPENRTIQYKYFQDMMCLNCPWKIYFTDKEEIIVFHFDNHVGIIMGMYVFPG